MERQAAVNRTPQGGWQAEPLALAPERESDGRLPPGSASGDWPTVRLHARFPRIPHASQPPRRHLGQLSIAPGQYDRGAFASGLACLAQGIGLMGLECPFGVIESTLASLRLAGESAHEGIVLWLGRRCDNGHIGIYEAYSPDYSAESDMFHI